MVHIKGSPQGIVIAIENTDYDTGKQELIEKLLSSKTFFSGSLLKVHMTSHVLTEAELFFLRDVVKDILCETHLVFMESEPKMLPQKHSPLEDLKKNESITKYILHSIPSGKKVTYEHSIVIFGDIEADAMVKAGGNVIVMGGIYGTVHAGKDGNRSAFIVANKLTPKMLMIDTIIAAEHPAIWKKKLRMRPEIAYIKQDTICVKPYV